MPLARVRNRLHGLLPDRDLAHGRAVAFKGLHGRFQRHEEFVHAPHRARNSCRTLPFLRRQPTTRLCRELDDVRWCLRNATCVSATSCCVERIRVYNRRRTLTRSVSTSGDAAAAARTARPLRKRPPMFTRPCSSALGRLIACTPCLASTLIRSGSKRWRRFATTWCCQRAALRLCAWCPLATARREGRGRKADVSCRACVPTALLLRRLRRAALARGLAGRLARRLARRLVRRPVLRLALRRRWRAAWQTTSCLCPWRRCPGPTTQTHRRAHTES